MNNSVEILQLRASWFRKIRHFFDSRGFLEVQTPILSRDTVVDRYIEPIPVKVPVQGKAPVDYWLQTSPEFCMKRLVADGADAIYEITPAFRAGENGDQHNIEFTMLEWYRVGDDYQAGMDLLDDFAQATLDVESAKRISYRQAFIDFANVDPFVDKTTDDEQLNQIFIEKIEPALSTIQSAIIYDWPASQCALANVRDDETPVAERFELYVNGIELANGYHELTDADELLRRNQQTNHFREQDGNSRLPEQSRLLDAMRAGLPACCGVALGFDRLLMVATGKKTIAEVLPWIE